MDLDNCIVAWFMIEKMPVLLYVSKPEHLAVMHIEKVYEQAKGIMQKYEFHHPVHVGTYGAYCALSGDD